MFNISRFKVFFVFQIIFGRAYSNLCKVTSLFGWRRGLAVEAIEVCSVQVDVAFLLLFHRAKMISSL